MEKLNELESKRILDLVKNPLRLALMCQIWYLNPNDELPSTQSALYERFTRNYYDWKNIELPDGIELVHLNKALGKLARDAIDCPSTRFHIGEEFASLLYVSNNCPTENLQSKHFSMAPLVVVYNSGRSMLPF